MKRHLYDAQYKLNQTSTEKLPEEFRSGDTLPDPEYKYTERGIQEPKYATRREGSVQEGVSMTEPLYADTPLIQKSKRQ